MTETIVQVFVRKCIRCGCVFEAEGKTRICQKCRDKPKPKKICVSCGKEFQSASKKYCHDCLMKLKLKPQKTTKPCLWCKKAYVSDRPHQKFCCQECQIAFHAMENRIWSNARDAELYRSEIVKLESEGKNYQLIETQLFEESEENEE